MNIYDSSVIILYFLAIIAIVLYLHSDKEQTTTDYFLAGRSAGWIAIGTSLFATNISSEHLVGLAGGGASRGLAVGQFEWMAIFILILLGWFFAPIFLKTGVFTIPEFFEMRYDKRSKKYITYVSIFAYIITKISVTLFAGGLLLKEVFGWDMFTSAVVMILLTGLYTVIGGMKVVLYTQVFQTVIILVGSTLLTFFGLEKVGWIDGLTAKLPSDYFTLFKPISDPDFPWTGIIFGAPILAVWYWCTDQYIVQRILSAKNVETARRGTLLAAILKVFPVFIFVMPGLIAVALYPEITGDEAYPFLVSGSLLPAGIKGLVISGLIAAMMSSLASVFHSTSTLYTLDIYKPKHADASERKLVLVGRLATTIMVVSAIIWVPLIKMISTNVYVYLQSVQSYISPPIAAVFLLGFFRKSLNARGAFWALIFGGIVGLIRLVLEMLNNSDLLTTQFLISFAEINFLHFAIFLFLASSGIMILGSKLEFNEDGAKTKLSDFGIYIGSHTITQNGLTLSKLRVKKIELYIIVGLVFSAITFWSFFA
ncbi:MAG: sodium:solute symporter [Melioribacteraceae bacterium]|nr:sodium:solute symporter [Melioribacteraceae bacterium]MCF8354892.1 sodium:solute symporter [Melioribacteraceae bacterium]MCF8393886.1 sodium:solute symporter [Melioribacteraceae bacterium]MCF8419658.1 sodium:solute symporter [Melioribacteraceae bacterium]